MIASRRPGRHPWLAPLLTLALAGCSTAINDTPAAPRADLGCVDDSRQCVEQRQAALKTLLADKQRRWLREPATIGSYASGVRLFAFKSEKRRLSCDEIAIGRREAQGAPGALRGPSGQGLTPAQISRGAMFAEEVGKELAGEARRRCGTS